MSDRERIDAEIESCRSYAGPDRAGALWGELDWQAERALTETATMPVKLQAPFPWFGGKSRAAGLIWSRLGNVPNYVEPFAGSLAVLLARPHEPNLETVNDKDAYLSNFWRAVKADPAAVASWADWPVNECDLHARHRWLVEQSDLRAKLADPDFYDAKVAGWWVWGISQWIGGGWCSRPDWKGRTNAGSAPRGIHQKALHKKRPLLGHKGRGVIPEKRPNISGRSTGGVHYKQRPALQGRKGTEAHSQSLTEWMQRLADRLRRVRVCCGDWKRVVTPSVTWKIGGKMLAGILLDPPYAHEVGRNKALYAEEAATLSEEVCYWAIEHGENPLLRIALCGYESEHTMPSNWECVAWKANGGYGNQALTGAKNAARERIWFSPHCLKVTLF